MDLNNLSNKIRLKSGLRKTRVYFFCSTPQGKWVAVRGSIQCNPDFNILNYDYRYVTKVGNIMNRSYMKISNKAKNIFNRG